MRRNASQGFTLIELLIAVAILAVNMVGDGLRDMLDPRAGRQG